MRGRAPMVPTQVEETVAVAFDEPIPEVDAELGDRLEAVSENPDHERHRAFLAVVRGMVHGDGAPQSPPAEASEEVPEELPEAVPEEALGDCLPGLRAVGGARRRQTGRGRRIVRLVVAAVVVGACVALPWAVPAVPGYLADLVPGRDTPVKVKDPVVTPPTNAFVGPVGISQVAGPYDGVRLEAAGIPREVVVPRLGVDSVVRPISGQSGSLLPPSDPQVLGWWQEGRPAGAQYGSAVVTGHTVHTGGGALDHLADLVVGDTLRVRTDQGWIRYVVQRTRVYSKEALARDADQVFRLGGTGRLVLITCDDWNGTSYDSNAVVFAMPVDDQPS